MVVMMMILKLEKWRERVVTQVRPYKVEHVFITFKNKHFSALIGLTIHFA